MYLELNLRKIILKETADDGYKKEGKHVYPKSFS